MKNCHCCSERYTAKDHYYECGNCGHRYRPYEAATSYHSSQYRKSTVSHRGRGEFDSKGNVTAAFHKHRLAINQKRWELVKEWLRPTDNLLDIGAGAGGFANEVRDWVNHIWCLELDAKLLEECKRLGFTTVHGDFLQSHSEDNYDILTAWHVLEHIEDVNSFMNRVKLFSPRLFLLEVPTKRKLPVEFDGHIHMFTDVSMQALITRYFDSYSIHDGIQMPSIFVKVDL